VSYTPTAEEIADEIRQQIDTGVLRYRERLPDAATMADQWRATKTTARRAIAILRTECYLDGRRRVADPAWERVRREVDALRRAGLPVAGDRPVVGTEIKCSLGQCRNLAVVVLRSESSSKFQVRPRVSCSKHKSKILVHMRQLFPGASIYMDFFQDPYEHPSTKRRSVSRDDRSTTSGSSPV
jgi:DNA-binding transcriptional MocR family regulator